MNIPAMILDLVEREIPVSIVKKEIKGESFIGFEIDGFYKSDTVFLIPKDDKTFTAVSRYDERDEIAFLEDLVALNFKWWERSKYRGFDGWRNPTEQWLPLLEQAGYVETHTQKVVVVKR